MQRRSGFLDSSSSSCKKVTLCICWGSLEAVLHDLNSVKPLGLEYLGWAFANKIANETYHHSCEFTVNELLKYPKEWREIIIHREWHMPDKIISVHHHHHLQQQLVVALRKADEEEFARWIITFCESTVWVIVGNIIKKRVTSDECGSSSAARCDQLKSEIKRKICRVHSSSLKKSTQLGLNWKCPLAGEASINHHHLLRG